MAITISITPEQWQRLLSTSSTSNSSGGDDGAEDVKEDVVDWANDILQRQARWWPSFCRDLHIARVRLGRMAAEEGACVVHVADSWERAAVKALAKPHVLQVIVEGTLCHHDTPKEDDYEDDLEDGGGGSLWTFLATMRAAVQVPVAVTVTVTSVEATIALGSDAPSSSIPSTPYTSSNSNSSASSSAFVSSSTSSNSSIPSSSTLTLTDKSIVLVEAAIAGTASSSLAAYIHQKVMLALRRPIPLPPDWPEQLADLLSHPPYYCNDRRNPHEDAHNRHRTHYYDRPCLQRNRAPPSILAETVRRSVKSVQFRRR